MKWVLAVLGGGIVAGLLRLYWPLGYLALLIYAFWLMRQIPRFRRYLTMGYAVFAITLLSSTLLQTLLVRNPTVQALIQRSRPLGLLAGDPYRLAFWAVLAGLALGVLFVWAALQAVAWISSEFVLKLNAGLGVSAADARRYILDLILDRQGPVITVDNGQVIAESPPGILGRSGGPGLLVVRPGNAVVLEAPDGSNQVLGPGTGKARPFEKVKQVVDLRPRTRTVRVKDAPTRDQIRLTFHTSLTIQIEPKADTDLRPDAFLAPRRFDHVIEGAYPVYAESVYRAVYKASREGWEQDTAGALAIALRDVIAEYDLDRLLAVSEMGSNPVMLSELEAQVQKHLEKRALAWGVKIGKVDITTVEMPPDIWRIVLAWWQKKWETKIAHEEADRLRVEADSKSEWLELMLKVLHTYAPELPLEHATKFLLPYVTRPTPEIQAPSQAKAQPTPTAQLGAPAKGAEPSGQGGGEAPGQDESPAEPHDQPNEEG